MGMKWTLVKNDIPTIIAQLNPRIGASVKQAADIVRDDVKERAPVDTGALRDGYYSTQTSDTTAEVRSGDDILYADFVESGHHTRSGSWVPAQPHFAPAFDAAQQRGLLTEVAIQNKVLQP